ncbi:MAG: TonB-dependent receptor [Nitrospirae bacterium]|nr:TonB-dependent receptor [Nitrospirota bacterium]MBF0536022.1 TonB-dependent receptor [Nitrospirota bacterium]MBF0617910.1 TonB-dependent receptor [Nitrospirota bacterium]
MRKKIFRMLIMLALMVFSVSTLSYATNGDNLIGVGSGSREMGGTGIAAPQDAVGAISGNPAAVGDCGKVTLDLMGTLFIPTVTNKVTVGSASYNADSASKVYPIPSFAVTIPVSTQLKFGLAAYGVSGLGVDYGGTNVDNSRYYDFSAMYHRPAGSIVYPLQSGTYTNISTMQIAPFVRYKFDDQFSLGIAARVNYSILDLGSGKVDEFGLGGRIGLLYKPVDSVSLGLTYATPIPITYKSVTDLDGDGVKDDLKLSQPQEIGFGIAVSPVKDKLLLEADLKWVNWANADGFKDFDWSNQLVLGVGLQYKPIKQLALRAGYNYGKNPVNNHSNFNGSSTSMTTIQGKTMPTYYYESFRITGFPGIVEHHLTGGIQYTINDNVGINAGYMHAFKNTITENGTNMMGTAVSFESSLSEDSVELGVTVKF